ncbi:MULTISPECIES: GH25 family lysozyme [unclassified Bacillus (in: firmicutes)]|uniref:GH25 family lysozyme n=1 Tax=unclassified Bacillus (in: firmicutes) TaxID=185979 RepID=UPI0008E4B0E5|nr:MULTISPECIES: GH25 family lysozyme [unclassified Bacillus (in: firmicutes)]SFI28421.1 Lyzozyme M1 (1,4-beta-N-acetylmuramidase), GH25 family [Bacillus sp. 71mf]SFS39437.1 Lyzozyme M1 (1,4-beta-N-acetylmuramidase), GH25 family [Bacillus sp. 103mf]
MNKNIVDISKYNDKINWNVAAPNLDLAICRVQYGSNKVDNLYKQHVANLEARGIPHAAYAYGCYVSVEDAIVEAKDFMTRVSPNAKFLVLDVEDDTLASCGSTNLAKASQVFIDTCKSAGWKVGFYVSHHMYSSYGLQNVKADFLWIPRYGAKPVYACDLWQYADNATGGYVEGIGNCDVNRLNSDKTLEWFIGKGSNNIAGDNENVVLPPDWKTNNLGGITVTADIANVRENPSTDAKAMRQVKKGSGHVYLDWHYDGSYFWYKIAEKNWLRADVCKINKDGKNKGVVWVNGTDINLRKGASTGDAVVEQINNAGAYDVHYRYENWIFINGGGLKTGGWMYFDESYVNWIR